MNHRKPHGLEYETWKSLHTISPEHLHAILEGIQGSLISGILLGYPLINVKVEILDGWWSDVRSDEKIFWECAIKCMQDLIKNSTPVLLEPFMNMVIEIPTNILGDTLNDITGNWGGRILEINNVKAKFSNEVDVEKWIITCLIPLSSVVGYSKYLWMNSHGQGKFVMSFSHYEALSGERQEEVLKNPFF